MLYTLHSLSSCKPLQSSTILSSCWKSLHIVLLVNQHDLPTPPWRISLFVVQYSWVKSLSVISVLTATCQLRYMYQFCLTYNDCSWYHPKWFDNSQANQKKKLKQHQISNIKGPPSTRQVCFVCLWYCYDRYWMPHKLCWFATNTCRRSRKFPPNVEIKNEIKNKVVLNIYMYLHGTGLMTSSADWRIW